MKYEFKRCYIYWNVPAEAILAEMYEQGWALIGTLPREVRGPLAEHETPASLLFQRPLSAQVPADSAA